MQVHATVSNSRLPRQLRFCERCGVAFSPPAFDVRRGFGRFCSRSCAKFIPLTMERLVNKMGPPTELGCRPWMGARDTDGYGFITYQRRMYRVTHAVWFLKTGHWPSRGEMIAHTTCDWPPCCEFVHLTLTDHAGNMSDMVLKHRQAYGERHWRAKLTEEEVLAMRARYARGAISMPTLAAQSGVSYATVRSAIKGESWKHLRVAPQPV